MRTEMEQQYKAKVIVYEDGDVIRPGGMCRCCGAGPDAGPDYRGEPFYIYTAGLCDGDGVYYSMLCESCLEDMRFENEKRARKRLLTERDETARDVTELMGDDIDGAQSFMDDLQD